MGEISLAEADLAGGWRPPSLSVCCCRWLDASITAIDFLNLDDLLHLGCLDLVK